MSSENNINSVIFEVLTISFIIIKNNKIPRIKPCGTPNVIEANLAFILFTETHYSRLVR